MTSLCQRTRFRRSRWARRFPGLVFAGALALPLARPGTAHGGATFTADQAFHLGRCGDTQASPACNSNCLCDNNQTCALTSGQILASLQGRLVFTVDDAACTGSTPEMQTRLSLRVKSLGGADFSVDDRLVNLCGTSVATSPLQCGTQTSCPVDPALLCGTVTSWDESVLLGNTGGATLTDWLPGQPIPPSITTDIVAQLPSLPADAVAVMVGAREISSVDGSSDTAVPSRIEYCLNIWVITLPDPMRTTIPDFPSSTSSTSTSSLTDMGTCGACGDGIVDPGQECDDGNTAPGDGCGATCRREACWTCSGAPSFCQPAAARPAGQCRRPTVPKKAVLRITDKAQDKGDLLKWKWTKGQATADFGNPLGADEYDLCIYQDSGSRPLLFGARAPAGGTCDGKPCWTAKGNGGFKYKNTSGVPGGLVKLLLRPGADGKAKIRARAKGAEVTLPLLPLTLPVLAQLQRIGQPDCWEASYSGAGQIANDAAKFKGKAD